MELKGSKTEANLWKAFAGESMARNKYTYFASKARKEGYEQIAAIFEETAGNEKEHAKLWFKALSGIGDTAANLLAAAEGEHEEWPDMYKEMSETAREEGRRLRRRGQDREEPRGPLCEAGREPLQQRGLQARRGQGLVLPQLRPPGVRHGGPQGLPRVRPSPGLL